jgi:hypothetical protein
LCHFLFAPVTKLSRAYYRVCHQDFNTATLPHEKYYNLDIYERKKASQAAAKAGAHQVKHARDQ